MVLQRIVTVLILVSHSANQNVSSLNQYPLFLEQTDSYYYYYMVLHTRGIRRIFLSKHVGHVFKAIMLFVALDLNIVALHKHFLQ
jgi:hypothetical protein